MPKIYIDGEAGTTGLQIQQRLKHRKDIELILLNTKRRDIEARRTALNSADLVILCLPDQEAIQAVNMIEKESVKIIDASTAHRTHKDWVYGFPEYEKGHSNKIRGAHRVSNPGCYAICAISMLYPLLKVGLIPPDWPISLAAVSGYSGGGKNMIAQYEKGAPFQLYGLNQNHKHLPEIQKYTGLSHPPIFVPSVANFAQGMAVELPIPIWALQQQNAHISMELIYQTYQNHYQDQKMVQIMRGDEDMTRIEPASLAGQDLLHLYIFSSLDQTRGLIVGLLDNLGKGASGQAIQNMELMLDL